MQLAAQTQHDFKVGEVKSLQYLIHVYLRNYHSNSMRLTFELRGSSPKCHERKPILKAELMKREHEWAETLASLPTSGDRPSPAAELARLFPDVNVPTPDKQSSPGYP